MAVRLRLLQGATALLYLGPLLAGMAGYGWAMLPPFVSIFVFWLIVLRPQQWPQTLSDWRRPAAPLSVLTQVLTQVLLVAVLFGIGRGIGGVAGNMPMLHPFLPLAISFFAFPLSRLVWNSEKALKQGLSIDELMHPHQRPDPAPAPRAALPRTDAAQELQALLAMPGDAPLDHVGPALDDLLDDSEAWARLADLTEALEAAPGRHRALREALAVWATDPEHFASNALPTALRAAFRAAGAEPGLLRLLLPRAAALARIMPERHAQFPDRAELEALASLGLPRQLSSDLSALLSALSPRAGQPAARRPAAARMASAEVQPS